MQRVPMQSICVQRDGKRVWPEIGQAFDFTKEEVEQGEAMDPTMFSTVARVDVEKNDVTKKGAAATKAKAGSKPEDDI